VKIIFICTKSITFNTFLKSQSDYLIKKGFKVEVACSDKEKLSHKKKLNHKINFPTRILEFFNLIIYIKVFFQIKSLVKKNTSALFFIHTPIASHLFRIFTFFNKLKIIYFVHGFRFTSKTTGFKAFFFKLIEKVLSIKTNIFITINNEDYNYAKSNLIAKNLCYKINGVGLDPNLKNKKIKTIKKKEIKKILVIAAYKKEKGYFEILKVAEMLKNKKIHVDCYGYGDYQKFKSIKIKNKLKNISFYKFDIKLKNKIKRYDVLLHLSKREGLPVSVMQSLLNGLPVICYNIRGNNDLIKDRFNGFFVKTYRDVPSKILYLNSQKSIFLKIRNNAIKSINKNFFKKEINLKLYKIINNYIKCN
tara:strand:+ start:5065 stop:6150 length:1086 start_codon:yes stop_codon:yes gene_type:complete